jgi:hypothetical protein
MNYLVKQLVNVLFLLLPNDILKKSINNLLDFLIKEIEQSPNKIDDLVIPILNKLKNDFNN